MDSISFGTFEPPPFDQAVSTGSVFLSEVASRLNGTPEYSAASESLPPVLTEIGGNGEADGQLLMNDSNAFFGEAFLGFNHSYRAVHGELSLAVCVFGIIANVLNIIVLSRKNMVSPTNAILTAMAVSDLVVIATYIPFVIHNFMRHSAPLVELFAYGWAVFTLLHAHISVVFHTISIWLTVLLAVWRYITVRSHAGNRSSCSVARAKAAIALTYLVVPCLCVPVFLNFTIYPFEDPDAPNMTLYKVDMIQMDTYNQKLLEKINFWAFSVLLKLTPCILLTILSLALIRILYDAGKRKERLLTGKNYLQNNSATENHLKLPSQNKRGSQPQVYLNISKKSTEFDSSSRTSRYSSENAFACNPFNSKICQNILDKASLCCGCCCCCGFGFCFCFPRTKTQTNSEVCVKIAPAKTVAKPSATQTRISANVGNSERTTRMLIVVLLVFLICEIPAGILALLSGILGKKFFNNVYNNFGELQDMLALINSAVNFVLYCAMSQQFRSTFSQLFCFSWSELSEPIVGNLSNQSPRGSAKPEATAATEIAITTSQKQSQLNGAHFSFMENLPKHQESLPKSESTNSVNSAKSCVQSIKSLEGSDTIIEMTGKEIVRREITLNDQIVIEAIGNIEEQKSNWL